MSLNTRFYRWRVVPRRGVSGGVGVLAGTGQGFWLDGSEPADLRETPAPGRSEPVRNVIPRPTGRVVYGRQAVAGGPSVEVAPRPGVDPMPILIPTEQRFQLTFVGIGPSGGIPISATWTFSSDPSYGGEVHFVETGSGTPRRAQGFMGDGAIIDLSAGVGSVFYGQIVLLQYPWNILGGGQDLARRLEQALVSGRMSGRWQEGVRTFLTPQAGAALVGGYGSGGALGVTLYTGMFYVRE